MSEQIRKEQEHKTNTQKTATKSQSTTDVSKAKQTIDEALSTVLYGAEEQEHNITGHSVAEVRKGLKAIMGIPADAQARVDGKVVDGDYILQENETLEFVKVAGQKG